MLFNSFDFLIFFTVVYLLFFLTKGTVRHVVLFVSSCIFYAWFIPKYLLILFVTIGIDYYAAIKIEDAPEAKKKKIHLLVGIINTCAILFIFKYHNFFIDNLNWITDSSFPYWHIVLPIGLSFHVFQSLSYVIDVYRKKIPAERNLLIYSNFVMMFPQLVAGPIERAGHLIPQLKNSFAKLDISDFHIGITLFMYGLFKKMVVADNIAPYVDAVYNNHANHSSGTLILATLLFTVQIYADFSGYSDMAIGIARTLGFRFNDNFTTPFFSRSVTEFWRRWHISLSSWLRDYLYYPLIFTLGHINKAKMALSVLITFGLIGLWHGANWTFVIFGLLHGLYLVIEMFTDSTRKKLASFVGLTTFPRLHHMLDSAILFILVSFSFIFFRSTSIEQALGIIKKMVADFSLRTPNFLDTNGFAVIATAVAILFTLEYFIFRKYTVPQIYANKYGMLLCGIGVSLFLLLVLSFGWWGGPSFIYFQF